MAVICFTCVSLYSGTVQLHDRPGSRLTYTCSEASFSSKNGDTDKQSSLVRILWAKGLNAKKNIRKEMFYVYGGECLPHKAVHN
jgi:hypothetical protein